MFLCNAFRQEIKTFKIYILMKGLLKNLGLILILVAAAILIGCSFTHNVNDNVIYGVTLLLLVAGLVSYIVINKKIVD